jgi:hypothetical protein
MSDRESWYPAGADRDGFVEYGELARRARELPAERFVREYPQPALLVVYREGSEDDDAALDPQDSRVQLLTVSIKSAAILRYLNRVAFLAKRPGNRYAHLVSIGRSASNDITIGVDSVSKVHGYFVRQEAGWGFTDHGSTNGSTLNGNAIAAGDTASLVAHDVLQLGLEVMLELLPPASLYERLRQL